MIAIVLAAGNSSRFGSNKLVYPLNEKPLLHHTLSHIKRCHFERTLVSYRDTEVKDIVLNNRCIPIYCPEAEKGQSYSIRGALNASGIFDGCCFFVGDNPLVDSEIVLKMQRVFHSSNKIVAPNYNDTIGNPIIFPYRYKNELMALSGDCGGKEILKSHIEDVSKIVTTEAVLFDIDTTDDLKNLSLLI